MGIPYTAALGTTVNIQSIRCDRVLYYYRHSGKRFFGFFCQNVFISYYVPTKDVDVAEMGQIDRND